MGAEYFSGNYADFQYNPYLSLNSEIKNEGSTPEKEQALSKQKTTPTVFKFSEGKSMDEYRAGALSSAKEYIAEGDTDKNGVLSREEYIAMQKARTQKLNTQTGSVLESAQWDDEIHPQTHGSVFDAINSQKSTDGKPETIDEKELATYLSYADASDDKFDGKIQHDTDSRINQELSGPMYENQEEEKNVKAMLKKENLSDKYRKHYQARLDEINEIKAENIKREKTRNFHMSTLQDWYNKLFPKSE